MIEKRTERKKREIDRTVVEKPLRWEIPEDMVALWANNIVVQHTENEFILTFFQVAPPILIQPTQQDLESIESVPARAVARVVLTPEGMQQVLKVMEDNYGRFKEKKGI